MSLGQYLAILTEKSLVNKGFINGQTERWVHLLG